MQGSFGPSDQQRAADEQAKMQIFQDSQFLERMQDLTREELISALEAEKQRSDKLTQEVKELKEDKIRLSLVLEEEDERRANLFLRKVEELEASGGTCPKCALLKTSPSAGHLTSRSVSMSAVEEKEEESHKQS